MEKVKYKSLKWRFLPYMIVMVILAVAGMAAIGLTVSRISDWMIQNYATVDAIFYEPLKSPSGQTLYVQSGTGFQWEATIYERLYKLLEMSQYILGAFWVIACMGVPGVLFYRRRLKPPLDELMAAARKISQNDLDFKIKNTSSDEMGQLCASFEKMRFKLEENQREMWRQMDDRKRLNAAFSHDLRTPLTVLKGQSEMILKYAPNGRMPKEKVLSTIEMMQKHIIRLEQYTQTMNHLQKLEDIDIDKKDVRLSALAGAVRETGNYLKGEKDFLLEVSGEKDGQLSVDMNIFMQVFENLMSNSVRYAKKQVYSAISFAGQNTSIGCRLLTLTVQDDGSGFDENILSRGVTPFLSTEKDSGNGHFGMGLSICKILCEKHGGYLKLYNHHGGCVQAVFNIAGNFEISRTDDTIFPI